MVKIAITPELPLQDEARLISDKLVSGEFDRIHLRHPGLNASVLADIIRAIPHWLRSLISLHDQFHLASELGVGGVHLNRRNPNPPDGFRGIISASCHSIEEVHAAHSPVQYVTLSPIFNSISKPGYNAAFSDDDLRRLDHVRVPVIALGGVTPQNIPLLNSFNFGGYAMLSAAWRDCQ